MASPTEIYDLLILVDATYSMGDYLISLQTSLPKIISISTLTDSFSRIGLIAYRDYGDDDLLQWSGWLDLAKEPGIPASNVDLVQAANQLYPNGGGDYPEATKTGLAKAYEVMRVDATTIILLYTDAPPHTAANGSINLPENHALEQKALGEPTSYGGHGPDFMDWVHAGRTMALKKTGKKRAQVFSILEPGMSRPDGNYYTFLSTITGGACFYLKKSAPKDIAQVTVDLLLAWMSVGKTGATVTDIAAKMARYRSVEGIEHVIKEAQKNPKKGAKSSSNIEELAVDSTVLKNFMPKRKTAVLDFAERYKSDDSYRTIVVEHLQKIIEQDVSAVSLNPVFGSLWRAVCNDRDNPAREGLITSFGLQVERISNADEKERMKVWLAESYDFTAEVQEAIESVPDTQKYPCVYLDPTVAFIKSSGTQDAHEDEDDRPITEFSHDELLEIGRSCDYRILRRLGRVLTRLTFVNSAAELPAHIANAGEGTVTRIPMALASKELGRKFWKILLHIVVPGTMLAARPSTLLAALTIRLGIQPLFKAADSQMLVFRGKWNDIEIPENWNVSCLSLLLDADQAYSNRKREEKSAKSEVDIQGLLTKDDRALFDRLVSYKMLELNLKTTITAQVGWKPEKTTMPIGPLVVCRSCQYPRSVTMMGKNKVCGHCLSKDYKNNEERQLWIEGRVSEDTDETSDATWVECFTRTCRVQYIVYHPEELNVRAKCYYCREQSSVAEEKRSLDPAPWVECGQCLSRVIFPHEYRTKNMANFRCVACTTNRKTIIEVETTAKKLSKENSTSWLLSTKKDKLKEPLGGRSLFYQIKESGTENFCDQVTLFPSADKRELRLDGKLIRNTPDLITQLKDWISRRRTESGTCSLCFSTLRKYDINPACGRRGCDQGICRDCLASWYGLNAAGRMINISALSCPFCRRAPTAKTLHAYGMGIHAIGNLKEAVENAGSWVYAWCKECAKAKPYLERVCARGAPPDLNNWNCERCSQILAEDAERLAAAVEAEILEMEARGRRFNYEQRLIFQAEAEARAKAKAKQKLDLKNCPYCQVLTEKSMGCGHMMCTCGGHWCWFCGEMFESEVIYQHMDKVHGGWFAPEDRLGDGYESDY